MVFSGDTEIVKPGSYLDVWVVRIVQKDPKDKDSRFDSFVFWVFLHNYINDRNDLV